MAENSQREVHDEFPFFSSCFIFLQRVPFLTPALARVSHPGTCRLVSTAC